MLAAIAALIQLLSSSAVGVVLGHLFGWLNRREDARTHELDLAHEEKKWDHELALRDKDREMLKAEWDARAQVASVEVEGKIAQADADALRAAQDADKATYGNKHIDGLRGVVRPVLTFVLVAAALYVNYVLLNLLQQVWPTLDTADRVKLAMIALEWLFFQAGAAIGFWFGSRGQPRVKLGK
jgi:hypothetical protein